MFRSLFVKECKMISRSILYFAFLLILILFYNTQYEETLDGKNASTQSRVTMTQDRAVINPLIAPKESDGFYGYKNAEVPEQVVPTVANLLFRDIVNNSFNAYPYGFIRHIKLNASKLDRAKEIYKEITGDTIEETNQLYRSGQKETPVSSTLTYERFQVLMAELRGMIGKGSVYAKLDRYGSEKISYEEARNDYNDLVIKDHVSGTYARVFCDYMGIVLGFFPVFLVVAYALRDKRAHMQELIYSRRISTVTLLGVRFLSLTVMMFVPVLLLATAATVELYSVVKVYGLSVDWLVFYKYSFAWLLPTLLATIGIGYLLTELTQSAAGIIVQGALWIVSLTGTSLEGDYTYSLFLRHNTLNYDTYADGIMNIVGNRVGISILAIGIFIITVVIFNHKRGGRLYAKGKGSKISLDYKKQSLA